MTNGVSGSGTIRSEFFGPEKRRWKWSRWVQVAREREPYQFIVIASSRVGFALLRDLDPTRCNKAAGPALELDGCCTPAESPR